jgi:hypothetical protein
MRSKNIEIYQKIKDLPGQFEKVVFVVGNKGLQFCKASKSGMELRFKAWNKSLKDYTLVNNIEEKIDSLGMQLNFNAIEKIAKWYTTDELVKYIKDLIYSPKFRSDPAFFLVDEPEDSVWIAMWTATSVDSGICLSDKHHHWRLKMHSVYLTDKNNTVWQCDGSKTKWPFDKVPIGKNTYEPLLPLEYVVKTLQENYDVVHDPMAWKGDKIVFQTVTR